MEASSNPIVIVERDYESGGLFMGDQVSMPEAEVNIILDPFGTKNFELKSKFNFTSTMDQITLAAFAYPSYWDSNSDCDFEILQDQEQVEYVVLTFEQLIDRYNESTGDVNTTTIEEWGWIQDHHFATFDLTLLANTLITLEVTLVSSFEFEGSEGYRVSSSFQYCVGSAYSWSSETHEIITLEVKGISDRTVRIGDMICDWEFGSFFPSTGISETWNQTWAKAVWDLTLSEEDFEITHVGFGGSYTVSYDPLIFTFIELALVTLPVIIVIIIGLILIKRRTAA